MYALNISRWIKSIELDTFWDEKVSTQHSSINIYQYLVSEQSLEVYINTKKGPMSGENEMIGKTAKK